MFIFSRWRVDLLSLSDTLCLKAKTAFPRILVSIRRIAGGQLSSQSWKDALLVSLKLREVLKRQGRKGLCLYLKVNSVLLQQSSCGHMLHDCGLLGPRVSRTRSGIPRIIPPHSRALIKSKGPGFEKVLRFYLSVFSMYRVIDFDGDLSLDTIVSEGKAFVMERFEKHMSRF